jgi:cytochrome bd-type quinol oxidase subunit 1
LLLADNLNAKVVGMEEVHTSDWPNVRIVYWSFDIMVASGIAMLALVSAPTTDRPPVAIAHAGGRRAVGGCGD